MLSDLRYRIRALLGRERLEREVEEELQFHLDREKEKNRKSGTCAEEADLAARRAFGGIEQIREECRDSRGTRWVENFLQDCRYAVRMIGKNAVFSALIVLVLGIGIGANTAVFSVVHEVILKPLPFRDPARLLAVWDTYLPHFSKIGISPEELRAWQAQQDLFEETAWYRYVAQDGNLAFPGAEPIAVHADFISANLFSMLGTPPQLGRGFAATEDPKSALLSYRVWRNNFGSDPGIVGKAIRFNDGVFTVVGVMPREAQFPDWADLWLPKGPSLGDELTNPVRHSLGFVARLRSGVSDKQASERLRSIAQRLANEHRTTSTGWGLLLNNLQADLTGDVRPALLLLLGAAFMLLLIACANIASLLVARGSGRSKEMAIRAAVGASSWRIVQQLVTENLVLALLGGALGWILAKAGLLQVLPARATLEPAVILFLLATTFTTGIFFGLAPAIHALRTDAQAVIKSAAMTGSGGTTRSALVVLEFAFTLTLVIGAGILTKSFVRLMRVNTGFDPTGVLTLRILTPPSQKPEPVFRRLQAKLTSLPGVETVAVTNALPLIANRAFTSRFNIPGSPLINPDALPAAQIRTVSPGYFQAMRIAVRSGRVFGERDTNQPVVIINETMARRFWPDRDAVGIRFVTGPWGPSPTWSTIVGVVADVRDFGLDSEPSLDVYYPSLAGQYWVIKTDRDIPSLTRSIERTIHSIDPELAVSDVRSMDQIAAESARTRRWTMGLLVTFASLAFLLALVGIYGVMSWTVAQRTREVGIRVALGAEKGQVAALVLGYGVRLALAGVAVGILASFALRRTLVSLVYGVSTVDPIIYISVPVVMLAVALAACYVPARKAASVDPSISLRYE
jgi:putative ABC transport system permease protein